MLNQQTNKSTLEYIMHYGALLGVFWLFQYLFFIGQKYWIHFIYFYHLLNVVSPLLMYIFYLKYKAQTPNVKHNVWNCILFVIGICFFGSFFDAAIRYAHYSFIDPDFFANLSSVGIGLAEGWLDMMKDNDALKGLTDEQVSQVESQSLAIVTNKFMYIISDVISKIFVGFMFSLLIAFLTRDTASNPNHK